MEAPFPCSPFKSAERDPTDREPLFSLLELSVFQSKDEPEGTGKAKNERWLLSGMICEGV